MSFLTIMKNQTLYYPWLFLVCYFTMFILLFLLVNKRVQSDIQHLNRLSTKLKKFNAFINVSGLTLVVYVLLGFAAYIVALITKQDLKELFAESLTLGTFFSNMYGLKLPEDPVWLTARQYAYHPITTVGFLLFYLRVAFNVIPKKRVLIKEERSDLGTHGSSKWSEKDEVFEVLGKTDVGFILGEMDERKLVHPKDSTLNQIITTVGGSGSGKTAGYVITNVLNCIDTVGESIIVTDPKGEIYNKTSNFARQHGYNVLFVNLLNMSQSMRINVLEYVQTADDAMSIAEMIILNSGGNNTSGDPMWTNAELSFFCAILLYLKETQPRHKVTIKNILELGTEFAREPEMLDVMFGELPRNSEAKGFYKIFAVAEGKTRSGILIGFGSRLKLWVSNEVTKLTSTSDFDLNILGKEKTILYLLTRDSERTFDLIPGLIISQAFKVLYAQANNNPNEKLDVPVRIIADELANIVKIEELERKVSTMRSRAISIVPIFQNITQFKNRYDKGLWSEILGSSDTLVYLGSNDIESNEFFSKMIGKMTIVTNSLSESQNLNKDNEGQSLTTIGRNLLEPNEMTKTLKTKCIIIQRGLDPILADKHFYFKQDKWANIEMTHWNVLPHSVQDDDSLLDLDVMRKHIISLAIKTKEEADSEAKSLAESVLRTMDESIGQVAAADERHYIETLEDDSQEEDEESSADQHYLDTLRHK